MSSKADDFDVRYRDGRDGRAWGNEGDGAGAGYADGGYAGNGQRVLGGTVDYDLGYDANGWDTQGFRSPAAGYRDDHETAQAGSGVRTAPWLPDQQPGRRSRRGGTRGPRGGPKVTGSWWRHWTPRKALGVLLGTIGGLVVLGAIAVVVAYEETPVPTEAMAATGYAQSVVYSANGTLIGRFGTTDRQELTYGEIPQNIVNAVLAAEDRHFWTEGGISPTGIVRAAFADLSGSDGSLQGGSTITQQFVRNYYAGIGTQQTVSRKIKEIFVAMKVAKEKSKQWILTNYLNTIYLGDGAYGVQAAAETYFGKPVAQLSVAQDAVIAALIQQPSTYPLPRYRSQLVARWRYVIDGMVQMGTLSARQAATLKFPVPSNHVPQSFGPDTWDPYVMYMVQQELEQVYGMSQSQIYNGGYVIRTSIDDAKMTALYQVVSQTEAQIDAGSSYYSFKPYMHVGAVLENPANGEIDALYPGPGYIGARYNGTGPVITARQCHEINCEWNMAYQNREQVGSSFKPYILATAVKEGMNVQTSTLNGFDNLYIQPDTAPEAYSTTVQVPGSHVVTNDSPAENGPYTPQMAMAESINTAYSDLWHKVAGQGSQTTVNNIGKMAQLFGVDTAEAGITGYYDFQDTYGVALGVASLTVIEQGSMLATIDDNGVYHDPHLIRSITRNNVPTPVKITGSQVFSNNPMQNADMDSQVQYAMSEDTAPYGTAPVAAMSNGQEVIAKTGTTEQAQSAFFVGAIPTQALAVALFTSNQNDCQGQHVQVCQSLNSLGGSSAGGYGGTWPATIWHAYAENMFVPLGVEQFQPVVFTGSKWNQVPPGLRKASHPKKKHHGQNPGNGFPFPIPPPGNGNPNPYPTYSCNPSVVTCNPNAPGGTGGGGTQSVSAAEAGAAVGGTFAGLPATCLWVRRRKREHRRPRG